MPRRQWQQQHLRVCRRCTDHLFAIEHCTPIIQDALKSPLLACNYMQHSLRCSKQKNNEPSSMNRIWQVDDVTALTHTIRCGSMVTCSQSCLVYLLTLQFYCSCTYFIPGLVYHHVCTFIICRKKGWWRRGMWWRYGWCLYLGRGMRKFALHMSAIIV